ncbi:MAG: hypothetical protein ACRD5M_13440 [Candidatus Acidiferrales bacterium]
MPKRPNKMRWIMVLGGIALIGTLLYSSLQQTHLRYEVCVSFKGGMHCASATGATSTEAIRAAQDIDCQFLANGRDENMVCTDSPPSSVQQLK